MSNPAYVQWIEMVKGDESKLVHPGNVQNHLNAGWSFKNPADAEKLTQQDPVFTYLTTQELSEMIVKHQEESTPTDAELSPEAKKAAKKAAAEAKRAAKKAAAEAKRAAKKVAKEAKVQAAAEETDEPEGSKTAE